PASPPPRDTVLPDPTRFGSDDRLSAVPAPPPNRRGRRPVVEDAAVPARARGPAPIQGRRKPRRESPTARGVPQLVGMAAPPGAEQVALVAERQAAGVDAQRELPQLTFGAGITDGQIEMDRGFREMA